ncbi:MAG: hypothetical protein ACRENE_24450, partial [Polyangiaceae bacterium]
MDCEAFEASMIDELYGELDELTSAAMKRHASGCSRCAALLDGLRATRKLAAVPMVDVPAGLTERILAAAEAHTTVPLGRRIARAVSVGGTWAMRPQSAMAAVFMVMLGTSLLLLRGRSSRAPADSEVTVTEHGTPAPAPRPVAQTPPPDMAVAPGYYGALPTAAASASVGTFSALPAAPGAPAARMAEAPRVVPAMAAPMADQPLDENRSAKAAGRADLGVAGPTGGGGGGAVFAAPPPPAPAAAPAANGASAAYYESTSPFDAAVKLYQSGRYDEAARAFEPLAAQDVNADLYAARSIREGKGCPAAVARFDRVAQRAGGTPPGWDALLEGGICYRSIGDFASARARLIRLLSVDSHKDRARAELDRMGDGPAQGSAVAAPAKAARPRAAAAAPAGGGG